VTQENITFKHLAEDALKYMSPQRLWTYPRADVYMFYSLHQRPLYNCSAPFWRNARDKIFHDLRCIGGHPTIAYFVLVKHNESSLHLPTGDKGLGDHLYLPMTDSGSIIVTPNTEDSSYLSACKDVSMHSPQLVPNWADRGGKKWKYLKKYEYIMRSKEELVVILPKPDTMYFHIGFRDD